MPNAELSSLNLRPRHYGDNPIEHRTDDRLSRSASVDVLRRLLEERDLDTPIVLGVFGEWGSGKSSVMRMLYNDLAEDHVKLWFEAWQYAHQNEALWRSLLLSVIKEFRERAPAIVDRWAAAKKEKTDRKQEIVKLEEELDQLTVSLYRSQEYEKAGRLSLNWREAFPFLLRTAADFCDTLKSLVSWLDGDDAEKAKDLLERERVKTYRDQVQSLEQFQENLRRLVTEYVLVPNEKVPPRLFIFVDDLDRCLPEAAVSALEALKLFLQIEGCVFVLGMDRSVVEQGIRIRYRDVERKGSGQSGEESNYVNASKYLDKIIQIPFYPATSGARSDQVLR